MITPIYYQTTIDKYLADLRGIKTPKLKLVHDTKPKYGKKGNKK